MFEFKIDDDIRLRLLNPDHAPALFAAVDANRAHLRQWLPWLDTNQTVSDTLAFIEMTDAQAITGIFVAGIWDRGELCGVIGHNRIDWDNRIGYIGYWLAADRQGRGIMTRACAAVIDHAFDKLKLNRIDIRAAVENKKSRAIPERLGFRQEGVIREAEWLYDHFVDHAVYGLLAVEWSDMPHDDSA